MYKRPVLKGQSFFRDICFELVYIDIFKIRCYTKSMRELLSNNIYKNKDGSINYERMSKATGLTKADLLFLLNSDFNLFERAFLISGVLVGKKPIVDNGIFNSRWDLRTCYNRQEDLRYVTKLIASHGNEFNRPYEYFIMDSAGGIISSNCAIAATTNAQEIIHLTTEDGALSEYVYPAVLKDQKYKCYYCHDTSMEKLNTQIDTFVDKKYIVKPAKAKTSVVSDLAETEERHQ